MAIRNIIAFSDERFRKKSKEITAYNTERINILLDDMLNTLRAVSGYGCAAVHVGILKRAVVIDDENGVIELLNPVTVEQSDEMEQVMEGSISEGAPRGLVTRPKRVVVNGYNRKGEPIQVVGEGFLAATLCHEIDHLDGVLFSDKIIKNEA